MEDRLLYWNVCYNIINVTKGGTIMLHEYRYWSCELRESKGIISLIVYKDIDEKLKRAEAEIKKAEEKRKEAKEKLETADSENIHSAKLKYSMDNDEYIKKRAELSKLEEQQLVHTRNTGVEVCVERLKDIYSRKENIIVTLIINDVSDGKVISTVGKIKEDIYKLEDFGIYLTAPYYDELAKMIANIYYDIKVREEKFIENDVPESAVKAFASMIYAEIKDSDENFVNKKDSGYYDIPVKIFKGWYENSAFRRFTLTNLKEALILHGYARANKGRNEYTVANIGKVVRLKISELEKVEEHEE